MRGGQDVTSFMSNRYLESAKSSSLCIVHGWVSFVVMSIANHGITIETRASSS